MRTTKRHDFLEGLAWGLLHALLFGLAFPPIHAPFAALLATIPLIIAAVRAERSARAALGASLGSIPFWAYHHQYVWAMSELGVFPLVLYLSIYPGLFVWLVARVHRGFPRLPMTVVVPILWVGLEVLRGEVVWHGYAWFLLGHPFIESWPAALAPVLGVYGVSAVIAALAGVFLDLWSWGSHVAGRFRRPRAVMTVLLAAWVALVVIATRSTRSDPPTDTARIRVAAVQTSVPQDNKSAWTFDQRMRDFEEFIALTRSAASANPRPDLIAWPETMFPGNALNEDAVRVERDAGLVYAAGLPSTIFHDRLMELQEEIGVPMLVGARAVEGLRFDFDATGRITESHAAHYNSAFLVERGGVAPIRYDKIHLTPFGEYMPYIGAWPWLQQRLLSIGGRGMTFDLGAGRSRTVFPIGARTLGMSEPPGKGASESHDPAPRPVRVVTPICFEATVPSLMRRLVYDRGTRRADLIVNLSNDGWFAWFDAGRENLVLQCRWRCLELGTPMLRAVNTGISVALNARGGREHARAGVPPLVDPERPARSAGVILADLPIADERGTIYGRVGDVFGWTCFGVACTLAAWSLIPIRRPAATGEQSKGPLA